MSTQPVELFPRLGQLRLVDDQDRVLPLESTAVTGQISGLAASIAVAQRFGNPFDQAVELEYLFPLPETAAILDFELQVGARTIRADLREIEQARQDYEQARQAGQRAGLLEARRPNLFAIRLANVLPGEHIQAWLRYQERLLFDNGSYEWVFPMGLTPRYHSPEHPEEAPGLDAPVVAVPETVGAVEISLAVDAGLPYGEPESPSHPIEVTRLDERRFSLRLAGAHIPDHDFVLRYPVASQQAGLAGWTAQGQGGDYFIATLLPPAIENTPKALNREYVFVLDRSGSMSGEPIAQAVNALRACLRALRPEDRFDILLFDDQLEWFQPDPVPVVQAEIERADHFLDQVSGRGGTEIVAALQAALDLPRDGQRGRMLVFLTDGAVSAEERALQVVRSRLGSARIFTFGIGPSVNRWLLHSLARLGHGTAEFLGLDEDIEGAILRFQDRVSFPVLTDLELAWENGQAWDVHPSTLPDLYAGQPLEITGRLKSLGGGLPTLTARGRAGGQAIEMRLALDPPVLNPTLARLWARARIDDLLEAFSGSSKSAHSGRAEIIGLALEHRLVTPFTAFVAVDPQPAITKPGSQPVLIKITQPLPRGLQQDGFFGAPPLPPSPSLFIATASAPGPFLSQPASGQEDNQSANAVAAGPLFHRVLSAAACSVPEPARPRLLQGEAALRRLGRMQRINGSWQDDPELTAAALLAFVRQGHTTLKGHFRQVVERALGWLAAQSCPGWSGYARALAFLELAEATGSAAHRQAAHEAAMHLLAPASRLEVAASERLKGNGTLAPAAVTGLEELWLAVLARAGHPEIPDSLAAGVQQELVQALVAAL